MVPEWFPSGSRVVPEWFSSGSRAELSAHAGGPSPTPKIWGRCPPHPNPTPQLTSPNFLKNSLYLGLGKTWDLNASPFRGPKASSFFCRVPTATETYRLLPEALDDPALNPFAKALQETLLCPEQTSGMYKSILCQTRPYNRDQSRDLALNATSNLQLMFLNVVF